MSATAEALYHRHRLSADDYEHMGQANILGEDDRVELIDGEIIDIPPIGSPHGGAVNRIANRIIRAFSETDAILATQNPLRLSDFSEPEPDIALLRPRADFYAKRHPRPEDVLLLIEVAETSLRYDRDKKLPLYACAGIPESWLVDLSGTALWIYRDPGPKGYASVSQARDLSALLPLCLPEAALDLSGLF
ncbi:MAG: Uma2 family endonuclease [Lamprobacter sp.]|uniref:Uma2 family endonuclease n=1 Tax=Lamprobacter sp. TaxID=3100796 RepID=UPI002B25B69A|nr:Uma2 family endonuclease [Lamprobacter sp.]MEA3642615.1 Uma2 family endonuclease [Lamprobacter sp.]